MKRTFVSSHTNEIPNHFTLIVFCCERYDVCSHSNGDLFMCKDNMLSSQRAKKVVSDSPGLVDFAIGLVNSVFNLPDGQVMFYEEFE